VHVEIPTLDALLADYATRTTAWLITDVKLAPSPVTTGELERIDADLGIRLPPDYKTLALNYNLAAIDFNFSRFYPPVVRPMGLFAAFDALLNGGAYPFEEEYRRWGVVPVGEDQWQNELVLAVRQSSEPQEGQAREMTHPLASTRPYGTIWAFYPDEMDSSLRYRFEFVGSSFAQVLHMCLLCWHVSTYRREGQVAMMGKDELRDALATIDPTVSETPYWRLWIGSALKEV
jgi:hypothetical protein